MTEEKIYLKDIGGYEEEKKEAEKIINLMKNAQNYIDLGVDIPKGLILTGNPGVGKTMFAKAIANESGVPFYNLDVADEDDDAGKIRKIKEVFQKAKDSRPSIIFIDELTEIVSIRDFMSDMSRAVQKALLTEIDGVKSSNGVLVIATTSMMNALSPALLRSGRMDKRIDIDNPNMGAREAIADIYISKSPITKGLNAKEIARKSGGFTGADIKNLINEAMLIAIDEGKEKASMKDIAEAIPVIRFKGIKKKGKAGGELAIAYHELGHAICVMELMKSTPSISIERYGSAYGHVEMQYDYDDGPLEESNSKEALLNQIVTAMGGMAAEEIFLGKKTTGSMDDLRKAAKFIDVLFISGLLGFEYLGLQPNNPGFKEVVDSEAKIEMRENKQTEILNESLAKARALIESKKELIEYLAVALVERKRLTSEEADDLILAYEEERKESNQ